MKTRMPIRYTISLLLITLVLGISMSMTSKAHASSLVASIGPVSQTWYFAEGRVGGGFLQWLTIGNPGTSACAVNVQYDYVLDGSGTNHMKKVSFTVGPRTRYTDGVNGDLGIGQSNAVGATLSAIVTVNTGATSGCPGVVAERPMYFTNFHSTSSGTDVPGATNLSTHYYFADIPTGAAGESFLTILNPANVSANVIVKYYAGGKVVNTKTLRVAANARGTFQPNNDNLPAHVAAIVSSDHPVLVERPSYFLNTYGIYGSADVSGVSALSNDWLFAEGSTGNRTQENLVVANLGSADAHVTITLKSSSGATHAFPIIVAANSQTIWDVSANNTFSGATSEVAAEVTSDVNTIVAQRQIYTVYSSSDGWASQGVTDAFGASSAKTNYAFAEGFTSRGFNEWLLLQNPSTAAGSITATLTNMLGHALTLNFTVAANSRYTVNITSLVRSHLVNSGEDARAYAVSMTVQSSTPFVAERTMFWSAFGTQGGESVVGYSG
jgi:hypothetical protein